MKKLFILLLVALPMVAAAQVRVVSAPAAEEKITPYDSLENCPEYTITGMVGQELFLPPRAEHMKRFGYSNIHIMHNGHASTPHDDVAGHTFKVVSVEQNQNRPLDYELKLEDTQTGTNYYYSFTRPRPTWDFITLGYKAKYEAENKGKSFVALTSYFGKDFNTGNHISDKGRGSVWVFQEIIANQDEGGMGYMYTNGDNQTIVMDTYFNKFMVRKTVIDKLKKKYGAQMCNLAVEGTIKIGMPAELVKIAKGEPKTINRASYGEQWVYGEYAEDCIYFKNGKVTGWN